MLRFTPLKYEKGECNSNSKFVQRYCDHLSCYTLRVYIMAAAGTLATDAQILLAIGADASAAQVLGTNTDIWILMAESDMESAAVNKIGLVANYGSITAAHKQYLAMVASHRAAFYAINQGQNSWQLATTQSKLNVIDSIWQTFLKRIVDKDFIDDLGL